MATVQRRCVFYVSGFDPKGAAHYHGLYKEQSAKQGRLNGWAIKVGARQRLANGNFAWQLQAHDRAGIEVSTTYEFMRWDDVVRQNWPMRSLVLWRDLLLTTLFNLRHRSLWRMFVLSWPPAVALFAPFVWLVLMLLSPLVALALARAAVLAYQWPLAAGVGVAALSWGGLLGLGRYLEARYSMYWLTRSYAFTARQAKGQTPELEARLDEQARHLAERIKARQDDEVLVVGHSSGAIMAVSIVARACRLLQAEPQGAQALKLSLLTLGQCIPMLALLPQAAQFRAELALIGKSPWIDWTDFSAPPDGCCFALSDPMALTADSHALQPPKLLSPRFAQMFDAAAYRVLRRDKFQMHFQYLMAHDRVVDYDYFLITAGEQTLKERYAHLPSVTGFTGLRLLGARPMRAMLSVLLLLGLLMLAWPAKAQTVLSDWRSDVVASRWETGVTAGGLTLLGLRSWDWGSSKRFKFQPEGWFGKETSSGGADKLGHAFTSYAVTNVVADRLLQQGRSPERAALSAALTAQTLMLYVEVFDGLSNDHGFAREDVVANLLGTGLAYARTVNPQLRDSLDFRMQYQRSGYKSGYRPFSDYSGQKFLLALKLSGLPSLRETPWRYLELQTGYYTRGFSAAERHDGLSPSRHAFVGLGLNLNELLFGRRPAESEAELKRATRLFFEHIQLPQTTVQWDRAD